MMVIDDLGKWIQASAMSQAQEYSNDDTSLQELLWLRDIVQEALWNLIATYVVDKRFRLLLEEHAAPENE